jgi:hypothetical protein
MAIIVPIKEPTARVIGIRTDVSSVPGINPIKVYKTTATKAINII